MSVFETTEWIDEAFTNPKQTIYYVRSIHNKKHPEEFTVERTEEGYWLRRRSYRMFIPFYMIGPLSHVVGVMNKNMRSPGGGPGSKVVVGLDDDGVVVQVC